MLAPPQESLVCLPILRRNSGRFNIPYNFHYAFEAAEYALVAPANGK